MRIGTHPASSPSPAGVYAWISSVTPDDAAPPPPQLYLPVLLLSGYGQSDGAPLSSAGWADL